ncbi:unnamed protein product [Clonostachys rhizophaga]|uniref:Uncharacterized protein n=1 Tax=Clonostachys rhizophaga TaxID=160324 RepID=A0A9N9UX21_9HYPO|nr:unnamed protein product [Clonostachys rhizophaga]
MAPDKPLPLPLAPDRAALSNRISLLLSAQSSVLKTMNQQSSSSGAATAKRQPSKHHRPDEEELFREYARPNEGVGYVADAAKAKSDEAAREDRMLRGRLLGKRKELNAGRRGGRQADEDEEDDEGGRSSLGKRKRPKRVAETAQEAVEVETSSQAREDNVEQDQTEEGHNDLDDTRTSQSREPGSSDTPDHNQSTAEAQTKKKKKKRKNKNKKIQE